MIETKGSRATASQPLAEASDKDSYCVDRVCGPDRRRLCEMGLVEGAEVSVVNKARPGTVVVKVGGCRLALARGTATNVWVKNNKAK